MERPDTEITRNNAEATLRAFRRIGALAYDAWGNVFTPGHALALLDYIDHLETQATPPQGEPEPCDCDEAESAVRRLAQLLDHFEASDDGDDENLAMDLQGILDPLDALVRGVRLARQTSGNAGAGDGNTQGADDARSAVGQGRERSTVPPAPAEPTYAELADQCSELYGTLVAAFQDGSHLDDHVHANIRYRMDNAWDFIGRIPDDPPAEPTYKGDALNEMLDREDTDKDNRPTGEPTEPRRPMCSCYPGCGYGCSCPGCKGTPSPETPAFSEPTVRKAEAEISADPVDKGEHIASGGPLRPSRASIDESFVKARDPNVRWDAYASPQTQDEVAQEAYDKGVADERERVRKLARKLGDDLMENGRSLVDNWDDKIEGRIREHVGGEFSAIAEILWMRQDSEKRDERIRCVVEKLREAGVHGEELERLEELSKSRKDDDY